MRLASRMGDEPNCCIRNTLCLQSARRGHNRKNGNGHDPRAATDADQHVVGSRVDLIERSDVEVVALSV